MAASWCGDKEMVEIVVTAALVVVVVVAAAWALTDRWEVDS